MLPSTFYFTQSNLQDYVDCARRFQLRYVENQAWPGVQAEPLLEHERFLERGARFHRLVERHQLGLDPQTLESTINDPQVLNWWRSYLQFTYLHHLEGYRYPEFTLTAELGGYRFSATYDLLVVLPDGGIVIFDWKTYRRLPERRFLEQRVQTRLYMLVAALSADRFLGHTVDPSALKMMFWCVSDPTTPVEFEYSQRRLEQDRDFFQRVVGSIFQRAVDDVWPLVGDDAFCEYCVFRSLCDRGVGGGDFGGARDIFDVDESAGVDFGLFDVDEVGF